MSWKPIIKNAIGEGTPRVRIAAYRRGPDVKHSQVTLHISVTLAKFIRVKAGDRIILEIGTLADAGWMRISKGDEQKVGSHGHDGQLVIKFSGRRLGVTGSHPTQEVKFKEIIGKGKPHLLFMLPSWAMGKEN
jgi:hypothetical protein